MIFRSRLAGFGATRRSADDGEGVPVRFRPIIKTRPVAPKLPPVSTTRLTPKGPIIDAAPPKNGGGNTGIAPPTIIDVAPLPPPKPKPAPAPVAVAPVDNSTNAYDASSQNNTPVTSADFQTSITPTDYATGPTVTDNGDVASAPQDGPPVSSLSPTEAWTLFGLGMAGILGFTAYIHHALSK